MAGTLGQASLVGACRPRKTSVGRALRLIVVLCVWLSPAWAAADPVRVVVAGPEGQRSAIVAVTREFLESIPEELMISEQDALDVRRVVWPEAVEPAAARVWVDLGGGAGAAIYIADSEFERVLVRRVSGTLDVTAREEVGQIIRASVEALLAGAEIGITRTEAAEELGVSEPERVDDDSDADEDEPPHRGEVRLRGDVERRRPFAAVVGAGYRVQPWARRTAPAHGPAVSLRAWFVGPLLLGASVDLAFVLPHRADLGSIESTVWAADLLGAFSLGGFLARRVALHTDVGVGVSAIRVRNRGTSPNAQPTPARTRPLPIAAALLGTSVWLRRGRHHVVLSVRAGAAAELVDFRVEADQGAFTFDPWRVRPTLDFTVGYGFFDRFSSRPSSP